MRFHILSPFASTVGGTEQGIVELCRLLAGRCEVLLWSEAPPGASFAGLPLRRVDPEHGQVPEGGTLLIHGNFFKLGPWLDSVRVERIILGYNTIVRPDLKHYMIERLKRIGRFDIVYGSEALRAWVGEPGKVLYSRIDLARFRPAERNSSGRFAFGRLSRDVPQKHNQEDQLVYRHMAGRGATVRVMGGTCLAGRLGGAAGIELLPAGAEAAEAFLGSLDAFFYRVGAGWTEAAGRVIAEAMACGLPVVAHRNGGYREWIEDGASGFLFDTTAEAVQLLERLQGDPALRRRIGSAARAGIEMVFSDAEARAYANYYVPGRS